MKNLVEFEMTKEQWADFIQPVVAMADAVFLCCTKEGLSYRVLDREGAALVDGVFPCGLFERYLYNGFLSGESFQFAMDVEAICNIVVQDKITFAVVADGHVDRKKMVISTRNHIRTIMQVEPEQLKRVPKMPLEFEDAGRFSVCGNELYDAVAGLVSVSEKVSVRYDPSINKLDLVAVSESAKQRHQYWIDVSSDVVYKDEFNSLYGTGYLMRILNAVAGHNLEIQFGNTSPICIRIECMAGSVITFLLAPRICVDDE